LARGGARRPCRRRSGTKIIFRDHSQRSGSSVEERDSQAGKDDASLTRSTRLALVRAPCFLITRQIQIDKPFRVEKERERERESRASPSAGTLKSKITFYPVHASSSPSPGRVPLRHNDRREVRVGRKRLFSAGRFREAKSKLVRHFSSFFPLPSFRPFLTISLSLSLSLSPHLFASVFGS